MRKIIIAIAAAITGCASAPATRHPVGIVTWPLHRGDRDLDPQLWYPARDGTETSPYRVKPIFEGVRVGRGATYAGTGTRPLVIMSHGNWGTAYSLGWLATRLVDQGYLVLSLTHPGTSAESRTTAGRIRLWDRAADVSRALDRLLADPVWGPRIDRARIGFVGHSFGAWTGLALAGGIYRVDLQRAACRATARRDAYCAGIDAPDVAKVPLDGDGQSVRDPRIRAFILLAGGPYAGFEPASLATLDAPIWFATARRDEVLAPAPITIQIPHATETTYDSGHFAFIPLCNWLGRRLHGDDLCHDLGATARPAVHDDVATNTVAFFARALLAAPSEPPVMPSTVSEVAP